MWSQNNLDFIKKLQEFGVLPNDLKCSKCEKSMVVWIDEKESEFYFRYYGSYRDAHKKSQKCNQKLSIKKLSAFEGSHLSFKQILIMMHEWVHIRKSAKCV